MKMVILRLFGSYRDATVTSGPVIDSYGEPVINRQRYISKHILIASALMDVLAIPHVILTFLYVCRKIDHRPFSNLVGFLPSMTVLFAFILPAKTYRTASIKSVKQIIPQRIQNSIIRCRN